MKNIVFVVACAALTAHVAWAKPPIVNAEQIDMDPEIHAKIGK